MRITTDLSAQAQRARVHDSFGVKQAFDPFEQVPGMLVIHRLCVWIKLCDLHAAGAVAKKQLSQLLTEV